MVSRGEQANSLGPKVMVNETFPRRLPTQDILVNRIKKPKPMDKPSKTIHRPTKPIHGLPPP
jgi:hypothetical protein